jgi:hypothetical protein
MNKLFTCLLIAGSAIWIRCDDKVALSEPERAFEDFWVAFDETYPYFKLKSVDWDSVYTFSRDQVDAHTPASDLKTLLAEVSLSLRDLHVYLKAGNDEFRYHKRTHYDQNLPLSIGAYVDYLYRGNQISYGWVRDEKILYLRFHSLAGSGIIDQDLLNTISTAHSLIIDIRENSGGNEDNAQQLMSSISSSSYNFEKVRFRENTNHNAFGDWIVKSVHSNDPLDFNGQIIGITNRGTYSSADSFALMITNHPNGMLVGDTTGGASGNPKEVQLANGWLVYVSQWQAAQLDDTLIEDYGIAPDVVVYQTPEAIQDKRDLMLENAIKQAQ